MAGGFRGLLEFLGLWTQAQVSVSVAPPGPLPLGAPLLSREHEYIRIPGLGALLIPVSAFHDPWQQVPTKGQGWTPVPFAVDSQVVAPLLAMEHYAILVPGGLAIVIPVSSKPWQQVGTKGSAWTIRSTR